MENLIKGTPEEATLDISHTVKLNKVADPCPNCQKKDMVEGDGGIVCLSCGYQDQQEP